MELQHGSTRLPSLFSFKGRSLSFSDKGSGSGDWDTLPIMMVQVDTTMSTKQHAQQGLKGQQRLRGGGCPPPPRGPYPQTETSQEGHHQGVWGVLATLGNQGDEEDIAKCTLLLSELLGRRKKRLNSGLRGKGHILVLSVNVGGSREAIEWALGQDCNVLLIQEHRMLGNPHQGYNEPG